MKALDKKTNEILKAAGITDSGVEIYLTCLGQLELTSADVIELTKMPRPTVLVGLKALEDAGLCKVTNKDKKSKYYQMMPIGSIKKKLSNQVININNLINEVDELELKQKNADFFTNETSDTQEELMNFLNLALHCREKEWKIISPRDNAIRYLPPSYIKLFKDLRAEREIVSQSLWEEEWNKVDLNLSQLLMRKPRYVPKDISKHVPALMLSFDDKLLIITGKQQPHAELITSEAIVQTYNIIFELAWRSCKS